MEKEINLDIATIKNKTLVIILIGAFRLVFDFFAITPLGIIFILPLFLMIFQNQGPVVHDANFGAALQILELVTGSAGIIYNILYVLVIFVANKLIGRYFHPSEKIKVILYFGTYSFLWFMVAVFTSISKAPLFPASIIGMVYLASTPFLFAFYLNNKIMRWFSNILKKASDSIKSNPAKPIIESKEVEKIVAGQKKLF